MYHVGSEDVSSKVFITLRYTKASESAQTNIDPSKQLLNSETETNLTLNGKKLYRISKTFTTASSAGSYGISETNIPSADIMIIDLSNSYLYTDNGSTYAQIGTHYSNVARTQEWFNTSGKCMYYHLGSQYVNSTAFVTILYTKSE